MQAEFGLAAGGGVGDDADQGAGLQIETGPRPQRAEYGLGRHVDEFLHDRVAVDLASRALDRCVAHELPPHGRPFLDKARSPPSDRPRCLTDRRSPL